MTELLKGKTEYYQWDTDQRLIVEDITVKEVHFCNGTQDCALICEIYEEGEQRFVDIPNILFQNALPIKVYICDDCCTKFYTTFTVKHRSKPADYVYTETEVKNWDEFYKRLDELELGARAIIDVEELPTEDINSALLYRVPEGVYWYDGAWHKVADESDVSALEGEIEEVASIAKGAGQAVSYGNYSTMITALNLLPSDVYKVGQSIMIVTVEVPDLWVSAIGEESTEYTYTSDEDFVSAIKANGSVKVGHYQLSQLETQKVDLTDYVKNTDYATADKGGVIKINRTYGLGVINDGYLYIYGATDNDLIKRKEFGQLRPGNVDSIVRIGLTTNKKELTADEQSSAHKWLGLPEMVNAVNEYTCKSYPHKSPPISGWLYYRLGLATTETISLDDLGRYEIDVEMEDGYDGSIRTSTLSLENATVTELQGGYVLSLDNYSPAAQVIVITDIDAFNRTCSCAFESTGTYLGRTEVDGAGQWTNYTTVKILRKRLDNKVIDSSYIDLENNAVIKSLMARIEALENK